MEIKWHATDTDKPPVGKVVLGIWQQFSFQCYINHEGSWVNVENRGYLWEPPKYWIELPDEYYQEKVI